MKTPLPAVHGFCVGLAFALLVLLALIVNTARADDSPTGDRWRRVAEVTEVTINVHVLSPTMLAYRFRGAELHGHAILLRNRETGAYTCNVYVTPEASPETLEHERRHCYGWVHR